MSENNTTTLTRTQPMFRWGRLRILGFLVAMGWVLGAVACLNSDGSIGVRMTIDDTEIEILQGNEDTSWLYATTAETSNPMYDTETIINGQNRGTPIGTVAINLYNRSYSTGQWSMSADNDDMPGDGPYLMVFISEGGTEPSDDYRLQYDDGGRGEFEFTQFDDVGGELAGTFSARLIHYDCIESLDCDPSEEGMSIEISNGEFRVPHIDEDDIDDYRYDQ